MPHLQIMEMMRQTKNPPTNFGVLLFSFYSTHSSHPSPDWRQAGPWQKYWKSLVSHTSKNLTSFWNLFTSYLTAPWPTLGDYWKDSLICQMLNILLISFWPGSRRPTSKVVSLSLAWQTLGLELATFQFGIKYSDKLVSFYPLSTYPLYFPNFIQLTQGHAKKIILNRNSIFLIKNEGVSNMLKDNFKKKSSKNCFSYLFLFWKNNLAGNCG